MMRLITKVGVLICLGSLAQMSFASGKYSPFVDPDFPNKVLWGDTHLHTTLSADARAFGATLDVEEAYRFARGEVVVASLGKKTKLFRPLDFLVVADHSDALGVMNALIAGDEHLMTDTTARDWRNRILQGGKSALGATMEMINSLANGTVPSVFSDGKVSGEVWRNYVQTADRFNEPGRFTAMIGYEWTSMPGGNNLHRNVLYRDGADFAAKVDPFTVSQSDRPEDLWSWMRSYEDATGGKVLALAHNGNLSNGIMFPQINPTTGEPIDASYAAERSRWEPLYEITQIKGDGEAHPFLSPNDEFADYETWDESNLGHVAKNQDMLQYEYAREALKNGLILEQKIGINPYRLGFVGSTDSHTALAGVEENNFFGKHSGLEPDAGRTRRPFGEFGDIIIMGWKMAASGYAAVWAKDNTREEIFDAMMRRETYATTGPRMTLRFFGGWDFDRADAESSQLAAIGYQKGVPMGGELRNGSGGKAPQFLVAASKDPESGNLDRIQIVKGWVDEQNRSHEKVYEVVWSGKRKLNRKGKLAPVGNTVDVSTATWSNSIGATQLSAVWSDPDFDPEQRAFYYARVIEIPTPRWSAFDAVRYEQKLDKQVPLVTQERAYSSPIWYQP